MKDLSNDNLSLRDLSLGDLDVVREITIVQLGHIKEKSVFAYDENRTEGFRKKGEDMGVWENRKKAVEAELVRRIERIKFK